MGKCENPHFSVFPFLGASGNGEMGISHSATPTSLARREMGKWENLPFCHLRGIGECGNVGIPHFPFSRDADTWEMREFTIFHFLTLSGSGKWGNAKNAGPVRFSKSRKMGKWEMPKMPQYAENAKRENHHDEMQNAKKCRKTMSCFGIPILHFRDEFHFWHFWQFLPFCIFHVPGF